MRARLATSFVALSALGLAVPLLGSDIRITNPPHGVPAFGVLELKAEVDSKTPLQHVEFFVDGVSVGRVDHPPFTLPFDIGQSNTVHHVRVVAKDVFGDSLESSITTGSIAVNMEVDVELLQLFVSVTDDLGQRVSDLTELDFQIHNDRGRREKITTFGGGDLPISSVVLVDSSESMQGRRLDAAIESARAFTSQTREGDETMVALFSDRLLRTTAFTRSTELFDASLHGVVAAGGTAVNDHLYYALNRLESRLGRRVIVLLSDGHDISSVLDMEQVQWRARRSQAMIYWIRLEDQASGPLEPPSFNSNWRDIVGNRRQFDLITDSVIESGGRIISISNLVEIPGAFSTIVQELRDQYVIGYHPIDRRFDGSWRRLEVETKRYGMNVRARAGYVD